MAIAKACGAAMLSPERWSDPKISSGGFHKAQLGDVYCPGCFFPHKEERIGVPQDQKRSRTWNLGGASQ